MERIFGKDEGVSRGFYDVFVKKSSFFGGATTGCSRKNAARSGSRLFEEHGNRVPWLQGAEDGSAFTQLSTLNHQLFDRASGRPSHDQRGMTPRDPLLPRAAPVAKLPFERAETLLTCPT